ncbi:MAG: endonuclease MutS2 [Anaerolineaceae bacterium]|nr:endonuclease MutS2 [Anaerolineaceae bacterium]
MLEYPQVVERIASYASFSLSEKLAAGMHPYTDPSVIRYKLELVTEARRLLSVNDTIRLGGCIDADPLLAAAEKSAVLEGEVIHRLAYMLAIGRDLGSSLKYHAAEYPKLAAMAAGLTPPYGLIQTINNTVTDRGEVLDSASDKLASIRREIHNAYNRLLGRLEKMLRDPKLQPMIQESIITQRGGRYVIPLKAECKGQLKSIIHDQSASGATIFVEPLAIVDANNAYQELQLAERDEVHRVLRDLSAQIAEHAQEIRTVNHTLAEIDFVLMCAKYADSLRANEPILAEKYNRNGNPVIKLYGARHPLLPADKAVPADVVLDDDKYVVIITGPNTGGKTVSLKTVGLMALMMQSGLHIPAESGSELSPFTDVFADIGDEQSIEQSLSTFSGHMTNQIRILDRANGKTLMLLDELGSGTDPQEGSALARAIMQYIVDHHIPCFAATHFSELKLFAQSTAGVTNASMEFDLKTLRPTYHLTIGLPGRSNALLIAKKLGLAEEILANAQKTIDPAEMNADSLLDDIRRQYDAAKKARSHADRMRSMAENKERELQKRLDEIEDEREKILQESQSALEEEVRELREELNRIRRTMNQTKAPAGEIMQLDKDLKAAEKTVRKSGDKAMKKAANVPEDRPLKAGEKVRVRSLGTESLAVISAITGDEAEIQLGALRMRVPLRELSRRNEPETAEVSEPEPVQSTRVSGELFHASPGVEIDLRGLDSEEMSMRLEKYLDDASLAGLPYVRIIHGKGTGVLRRTARKLLLGHPHVKFIESGRDNEGGDGVTVAHMK